VDLVVCPWWWIACTWYFNLVVLLFMKLEETESEMLDEMAGCSLITACD